MNFIEKIVFEKNRDKFIVIFNLWDYIEYSSEIRMDYFLISLFILALCGVGSTLCGPPQAIAPLWGEGL